jgi:hypothetical protein
MATQSSEFRFVGLVGTYIVFQIFQMIVFAICGFVAGWVGGTLLQGYGVGLVLGYWIWKASMTQVVMATVRLMEVGMAEREKTDTGH